MLVPLNQVEIGDVYELLNGAVIEVISIDGTEVTCKMGEMDITIKWQKPQNVVAIDKGKLIPGGLYEGAEPFMVYIATSTSGVFVNRHGEMVHLDPRCMSKSRKSGFHSWKFVRNKPFKKLELRSIGVRNGSLFIKVHPEHIMYEDFRIEVLHPDTIVQFLAVAAKPLW